MTFYQSLAVTLGSELGSTITAQLVAFKITKYALLFTAIGFYAALFSKTKKYKSIANTILGFGLLFLGMDIMSKALEPLKYYQPFLDMMTAVENLSLGILLGVIFTMIIQSSGAISGITVAMAMSGTITLGQAIPINLGASIGTCITTGLGSLTLNREAKRVAYIHTLFQTVGVIIVFLFLNIPFAGENLWLYSVKWITQKLAGTDDLSRQIAMAHTMAPVINHLLIFSTLNFWVKLLEKIYPVKDADRPFGPMHINDNLLDTPAVALIQTRKEILRVAEIIQSMLKDSLQVFKKKDIKMIEKIS